MAVAKLARGYGVAAMLLSAAAIVAYALTGNAALLCCPAVPAYLWLLLHNWKAAYWLLLATIPFSTNIGLGSLSTTVPDEPMTWLFALLLPFLLLLRPRLLPLRILMNPVVLVIILQALWVVMAVVYSGEPLLSAKYLLVRLWLLAVFFVLPFLLFKEKADFIAAFRALLGPAALTMLIVLLRHSVLGFGFMRINEAIGLLYYNHVEYSTVLSMLFPVACVAWPYMREQKRVWRALYGLALALGLAAIFLSYARAALLALVFAGVVALCIRIRAANLLMPVLYGCVTVLALWLMREHKYLDFRPDYEHTYMHHDLNTHLQATFSGTDMSGMERVYRWIAAARMSADKPLTGWGPNTFVRQYKSYTVPAFRTYVSGNEEHSTTHNYFLYLLAEQGWPAMLLYALLIALVLGEAQGSYHRLREPFYKRCTLGLAMMFAAAFVNNCFSELTDTHKVGALFFLSMSLIVVMSYKSRTEVSRD